jgi:membrane-associated phospholipid phosphatase
MASFGLLTAVISAAAQAGSADVRLFLIPVILAAGITASARLWLNAHTPQQLLSGFALGFCLMYFIL